MVIKCKYFFKTLERELLLNQNYENVVGEKRPTVNDYKRTKKPTEWLGDKMAN